MSPTTETATERTGDPMTGIERLRAVQAGTAPGPGIARLLGFELTRVQPGEVKAQLDARDDMTNPMGTIHGGIAATLLDTVMGCAVQTVLDDVDTYTTTDLHVHYMRAVTPGRVAHRDGNGVASGPPPRHGRREAGRRARAPHRARHDQLHGVPGCVAFAAMPVDLARLADDLAAETTWLEALVAPLDDAGWKTPTPAAGWSVHDQMTHLAYFDGATTTALLDPDRFVAERDEFRHGSDDLTGTIAARYRDLSPTEIRSWFTEARREMLAAFTLVDTSHRVPWYGPAMSAGAALTARIMETWAHGQDIADSLDAAHPPTTALRQVAHIGVHALPNSFRTHGFDAPEGRGVRVVARARRRAVAVG